MRNAAGGAEFLIEIEDTQSVVRWGAEKHEPSKAAA